jgi:NAD+ diphosphatase
MLSLTGFTICPRCGKDGLENHDQKAARCNLCGFIFYHNCAAAAAAIIETVDGILLVRRSTDPQAGKLDLPGGFVDYAESAESAVLREVHEELGLEIELRRYLGSYPNRYLYHGVTYFTTDMVFIAKAVGRVDFFSGPDHLPVSDHAEVEEVVVIRPQALNLGEIAFPSMRHAIEDYLKLSTQ